MGQSAPPNDAPDAEPRFEHLVTRLEEIVTRLESDELSLEDALDAYQEGIALAKAGHDRLADAERRIEEVTQQGRLAPLREGQE